MNDSTFTTTTNNNINSQNLVQQQPQQQVGKRITWDNDGPDDTISSMSVLLEWILIPGNYHNYKMTCNVTKIKQCLVSYQTVLKERGISTERNFQSIVQKIDSMEQQFKTARRSMDFSSRKKRVTLQQPQVMAIFPYYYDLEHLMGCALYIPLANSDEDLKIPLEEYKWVHTYQHP